MKILICGSRGLTSRKYYFAMAEYIFDLMEAGFSVTELIHGDCPNSPDQFAEEFAGEYYTGVKVTAFPADWSVGNRGGYERNMEMAKYGPERCIAIWDGKSRGTKNMIEICVARGIPVYIIPATLDS